MKEEYSVIELIHNDSFRRLIEGSASNEEKEFWNNWMEASEENRLKFREAMAEILGFKFTKPSDSDIKSQWNRLYKETKGIAPSHKLKTRKDTKVQWLFRAVAAVLLVIAVIGSIYIYEETDMAPELSQITNRKTVTTGENEQKILRFTNDGKEAKIVMNSNSSMTYDVGMLKKQPIKINLQGEAFFDVEKGFSTSPAFSVTTPYGIIEDIGTEFLVSVTKSQSRVILQEGVVNVKTTKGKKTFDSFQVSKGELVGFTSKGIATKSKVNSSFYTFWATGYIEFDQTKISAFADFVEKSFGTTVEVVDPSFASKTVDGAAYFNSLEGLIRYVTGVLEIPVYQPANRDTIFIGREMEGNNPEYK